MKKIYPPGIATLPGVAVSKLVYGINETAGDLDDDEPLGSGTAATHHIGLVPSDTRAFILLKILWYLANTNAVTHQLYLLSSPQAAAATERKYLVYDSDAAKARNTLYMETGSQSQKIPVPIELPNEGKLYYKIDYSAAAGATTGFIRVWGIMLERE